MVVGERYELIERLDAGGMGEVWKAADQRLGGKEVAVKRMPTSSTAVTDTDIELFRREALSASRLRHQHAVAITDFFVDSGAPYIVMEYVDGRTLSTFARAGGLDAARAARLGAEIASALAAAHDAGLVHRDVKPDNVIVRPGGSAVLVDFGIARAEQDAALTNTGYFRGTLCYLAPEILNGAAATPASDMWSFGATLFELVEGRRAFDGPTHTSIMTAVLINPIPTASRGGPLAGVIARLLDRDASRRPSAAVLARELARLAAGSGASDVGAPDARPVKPPSNRPDTSRPAHIPLTALGQVPSDVPPTEVGHLQPAPAQRRRRRGPLLVAAGGILFLVSAVLPWLTYGSGETPFGHADLAKAQFQFTTALYLCAGAAVLAAWFVLRNVAARAARIAAPVLVGILGIGTGVELWGLHHIRPQSVAHNLGIGAVLAAAAVVTALVGCVLMLGREPASAQA